MAGVGKRPVQSTHGVILCEGKYLSNKLYNTWWQGTEHSKHKNNGEEKQSKGIYG